MGHLKVFFDDIRRFGLFNTLYVSYVKLKLQYIHKIGPDDCRVAPSPEILSRQKKESLKSSILFSIITESDRDLYQSYGNYELVRSFDLAKGDYIIFLEKEDILSPNTLYEFAKAAVKGYDFIYSDEIVKGNPIAKPDYSPDTIKSYNYIGSSFAFKRELFEDCDSDYDLILTLCEKAKSIYHIPKFLLFTEKEASSDRGALIKRGFAVSETAPYTIKYDIKDNPLVSIIIPNRNSKDILKRCIDSLKDITYDNVEIIVAENNSDSDDIFEYYKQISVLPKIKIITYKGIFNYSDINNFAVSHSSGQYLLFLNNDTEVIAKDFIENMLMYAQREDVGAVGALLRYPSGDIQHAGVIIGVGGVAGHIMNEIYPLAVRNLSAVTAACLMTKKDLFLKLGGFDVKIKVAFNDVDLCLKIRKADKLIVFTPAAELYHHESISRGADDTPAKRLRFYSEINTIRKRWGKTITKGDPYYNPNLTLERDDFSLKRKLH